MGIAGWVVRERTAGIGYWGEGLLVPEMFLTNICIVSAGSGVVQRELEGEECIVWFGGLMGFVLESRGRL